jgi:NitT/TauT family transport system substrate-binding protein
MPACRPLTSVLSACLLSVISLMAAPWALPARAEVSELQIAKQYGISYLPFMLMEADQLVEKHAKAAGLPDLKVSWSTFISGAAMNDAILSGSLHLASGGVGPLTTIWARSKGTIDVKCVTAMNTMPLYLTTRNPNVKTIRDFTERDKIALPGVKVSVQAVTLQMAAEKEFGPGNQYQLDAFTVAMSHPDGQQALLSGVGEITAHFSSPPFQYQQLKQPGIHRVLNSYDVLGGPATFNVVWATQKFRQENPKHMPLFSRPSTRRRERSTLIGAALPAVTFRSPTTRRAHSTRSPAC